MANVIQIKRGQNEPTTDNLTLDGEIGYSKSTEALYIRDGDGPDGRIVKIGDDADSILAKLKTVDGVGSGINADLLDGLHASSFAPSSHTHAWADITGKLSYATRWPTWTEVTSKPTTFAPSSHTHAISNVTNLQTTLNTLALKDHIHDPEVLTLTLVNGYTGGTGHDTPRVYRIGKLAIVSGYVVPNRTQTTGVIFATLPTGWRPAHQVSGASGTLISPPNMFRYSIAPAGSMMIWPIHGTTERYPIDAVYVIGG